MTSDRWRQIEELYQAAVKLGAAERSALLAGADPELRREVEALDAHRPLIPLAKFDPSFDNVRSDPRFQALLARLKLPN